MGLRLRHFTKKSLAVALSAIGGFEKAKVRLEQYPTDCNIAADILWDAYIKGFIGGKTVADLGCGHGILGIGCMLLGAAKVHFLDVDSKVLDIAQKSVQLVQSESLPLFFSGDVADFDSRVDTVIMNPPFGTKSEHSDRAFLVKAFAVSSVVYSFHKTSTLSFIESLARDAGFTVAERFDFSFPLKASMDFHRRKRHTIEVSCLRFEKDKTLKD